MVHNFTSLLLVLLSVVILYIIFRLNSTNNKIYTFLLIVLLIYGVPVLYIYTKNKLKKLIYKIISHN